MVVNIALEAPFPLFLWVGCLRCYCLVCIAISVRRIRSRQAPVMWGNWTGPRLLCSFEQRGHDWLCHRQGSQTHGGFLQDVSIIVFPMCEARSSLAVFQQAAQPIRPVALVAAEASLPASFLRTGARKLFGIVL